jgi:small GTP-binding protein
VLEGHTDVVRCAVLATDLRKAISGGDDKTVRLWDLDTGRCLKVLEGHTEWILTLAWSANQHYILSGGRDHVVRLWSTRTGRCLLALEGHKSPVVTIIWSADGRRAVSGSISGDIRVWDLSEVLADGRSRNPSTPVFPAAPEQLQYTNAKVLLVGESGTGKTGLSRRLALDKWHPSDSTVGAWAMQWKLPVASGGGVERDIWLWDFGGQADQRLIHQLYLDDAALAVLVFDGQKDDVFETLGQWDRDLTRASSKEFSKLLVVGRADAGGLRISRSQLEAFAKERGFPGFLETSAKTGTGCGELKKAILDGIKWEAIPWRSSPLLFKRLKDEIVRVKEEGRVLVRFNELREILQLRLSGEARFSDDELKAVVGLLAGPGVVWELKFGSWVLLQPELINAYAQAVIQTMREDEHERGCIAEQRVLNGDLAYRSSMRRVVTEEERFVLLAMHQMLVERGLCFREQTDKGPLLIFPSYYRRERPELVGYRAVLVSYRFGGFLDEIYATLVVRLHHTSSFNRNQLWRCAAEFETLMGRKLGVKLTRRSEGAGELDVYFDHAIPIEEKLIFSKYVHEHLLQSARDVERLRHYVCQNCGTSIGNSLVAMKRLNEGKKDIICVDCERRIPLWDQLEELFASEEIRRRVHNLQKESAIVLDTESKERALVGEVISTVALAGQISREFNVSDHGIDLEVEFKSDTGHATGRKVYLQLKSGDSYLAKRKRDGAEVFKIDKARHADYWKDQAFPVLLVIRGSDGRTRWMDVRNYLRRQSENSRKLVRQIVFTGERFDVMSVRRWRDDVLRGEPGWLPMADQTVI